MIEPIDLSPELQRQSEQRDMEIMQKLDKRLGVSRYQITDVLQTINERLRQYIAQMPMTFEFLVGQTLQDFRNNLTVLQSKSIKKPVAMLKDGTVIYAVKRTRFELTEYPNCFVTEKPKE